VALVGLWEQPLREVEARIRAAGGEALVVKADVGGHAAMAAAVDKTVTSFGGLHHAVNNAGIASEHFDLPDLPVDIWDRTLQVNLGAHFYGMRVELPAIAKSGGGSVVNVSSVYGDRGLPFRAAYTASKHGVRGLIRSVARDWAGRKIRINELQPGVIDTPMTNDQGKPGEVAAIAKTIPAQRLGQPREIATTVAFLLSDEASYITGAHLAVDGGFLD
jgi:NAD(P)-dependent dehydrogenase (short-subunit alcohol dehydrogenase family)